ncbi:hypothetical protein AB0K00_46000 [Dactylosporangium sp. NPDC049525]|uniref:hypothetical protein n=1 Tax=Dactylosporangium sp. NPDC049525 TaxID=3154730 RepID=UPI0034463DE9
MRPRPAPVTAARWLLLIVATLPLVSALLGVGLLDELRRAYIAAYGGVRGGDEASGAAIAGVVSGGLILVICAVPALLLGGPRNWVRIVVWVLCTIGVCCLSPGVLGGTSVTSPRILSSGVTSAEITARIADTMPGWYVPVTMVLAAASVLGIVAVAVLLALPASNAYFRRPAPIAPPPQPWPGARPTAPW